jgi:hypothetical protein
MKSNQILIILLIFSIGLNLFLWLKPETPKEAFRLEGDQRTEIQLKPEHKEFILREMRQFVESIHLINEGITNNEPEKIILAGAQSGTSVSPPKELVQSMPEAFLKMGRPTHKLFDTMADSARMNFNPSLAQKQLTELTSRCVNCHATYRLEAKF